VKQPPGLHLFFDHTTSMRVLILLWKRRGKTMSVMRQLMRHSGLNHLHGDELILKDPIDRDVTCLSITTHLDRTKSTLGLTTESNGYFIFYGHVGKRAAEQPFKFRF
jgi:hypothetical protein